MSVLLYKRPDYIAKAAGPMTLTQCQIYVERTQKHRRAIPPELSFENIIQNKALPPCSLQDFMDYLVYISHDAENLQFFLWLQDYTKRFYAAPKSDQALSTPWYQVEAQQPFATDAHQPSTLPSDPKTPGVTAYEVDFDRSEPRLSPNNFDKQSFLSGKTGHTQMTGIDSVQDANAQIGLKWQAFSVQPFRSEINRVISHYLTPNSPRELNLSHRNRATVLHALQHTTHPSALSLVKDMVEATLRGQSHPNFIRWSICNGNKPRVLFVRNCGIAHIVMGIILGILLIISHEARWWRIFVFPLFFVGFDIGVAAYKGLCVIIHTSHHRALRPWEQFNDGASAGSFDAAPDDEANVSTDDVFQMTSRSKKGVSLETFGTSNNYSHELWVGKYKKKSLLKKIFTKTTWVQDETVRMLQDKIVTQSHIWALILSVPLTVFFVALPMGNII
ncbi:hypothetical protein N7G274_006752 [Stereocaulon virgatum]|uniref:RGS domain-containing protein n=1 Tax=Stereocaulon virgatum TaxID=373712 RepID=A0ABR4A6C1_9LECA